MTHTTRNPKGDSRAELLKVAREVFAEKGFEATTISEIVARAGVAQGTFYWYFPSKVSLITMLAKEMQDQIEEALTRPSLTLRCSAVDWLYIIRGSLDQRRALMTRRLRMHGDWRLALQLPRILPT